jgi:hypothetical protein
VQTRKLRTMNNPIDISITVAGEEIPTRQGMLTLSSLTFYEDNPRLYTIIAAQGGDRSQQSIYKKLLEMPHVLDLVGTIRANGGLIDPLVVRDGDYVVLEGNSRLAALRRLAELDPLKWGTAKANLLPADTSEETIFALLGEYHIKGKKDWAPYEQAGFLYRQHMEHDVEIDKIATDLGISKQRVTRLIEVYEFMLENKDNDPERWSYYDEYFKSTDIKKARQKKPTLDEVFVDQVKSGKIPRATDVRDKLKVIAKEDGKVLNDFVNGKDSFEGCTDRAFAKGIDNEWFNRFHKLRNQLSDKDSVKQIENLTGEERKKVKFEVNKIVKELEKVLKNMQ